MNRAPKRFKLRGAPSTGRNENEHRGEKKTEKFEIQSLGFASLFLSSWSGDSRRRHRPETAEQYDIPLFHGRCWTGVYLPWLFSFFCLSPLFYADNTPIQTARMKASNRFRLAKGEAPLSRARSERFYF